MKALSIIPLPLATAMLLSISISTQANEPVSPQTIKLPPAIKAVFLAQMQGHVIGLDGILQAIANGEFTKASQVARESMGIPRGAGEDLSGAVNGGEPGPGLGLAKYLPTEMVDIGSDFHKAANSLAELLKNNDQSPGTANDQSVYRALANVTSQCRQCHEKFSIE